MAEFPAMPVWTDAYLADCSHLSDAEHGVYFRLLMLMWRSPDCRVPNDDDWIARKLGRDANAVRTHVRPIISEFCEVGEWVTQKRLQREWKWCVEKRKKNVASANARWGKDKRLCEGNANALPNTQSDSNAPITTPIPLKRKKRRDPTVLAYTTAFEQFWSIYPRRDSSKADAFDAYQHVIRGGISHETLVGSLGAFTAYHRAKGTEPDHIPHASTWLNGRRWEGDYTIQPAGTQKPKISNYRVI